MLNSLLPEDLPALVGLFTIPEGREFLGGPIDAEMAIQRLRDWVELSPSAPIWAIRRYCDQSFLGYVLLDGHDNGVDTEISYALLPENWGQGFATDALLEAFVRAFQDLGLEELVAETQTKNHRSIKLLERVGMSEDGRLTRFGEGQIIYRIVLTPAKQ
jgi:RimJ/RimL family protein N-acetyltransferase